MIVEELINVLKNDSAIAALVGNRIEMFSTSNFRQHSIVFNFTPISDNKITRVDKLEIHIIAKTPEIMIEIHERVKELLLTFADNQFNTNIKKVELNGGGSLEDLATETYHQLAYYNITSKVR